MVSWDCEPPEGTVTDNGDCDDGDGSVNPGAAEVCDGTDNDCDGEIDEGVLSTFYQDYDRDGYGNIDATVQRCAPSEADVADSTDCNDTDADIHPGALEECDGIDNDCNGQVDDGVETRTYYLDGDGDGYGVDDTTSEACAEPPGYSVAGGDCNDDDGSIYPGAPELCDGIDNDCDAGNVETCWGSFTWGEAPWQASGK